MAEVSLNIVCRQSDAVALETALAVSPRAGAAALARFCRAVAGGVRDAKVSLAPVAAAAPAAAKKKVVKKAKV